MLGITVSEVVDFLKRLEFTGLGLETGAIVLSKGTIEALPWIGRQ